MYAFQRFSFLFVTFAWLFASASNIKAEVKNSAEDGFLIVIEESTTLEADRAFSVLVGDFAKWYDASHSYSGKSENLSMDLQKSCMFEKLPDGGFVRHMEIVFYQPELRTLRLTGGLGPLQSMGVSGALTFTIEEKEVGAVVRLHYFVNGSQLLKLDRLSAPVNQVLESQLQSLKKYCDGLK